jgi:hypothetical protein
MFFQIILAMLLGLVCPHHNNTTNNNGTTVTAQDTPSIPDTPPDTGGETGNNPPR